MSSDPQAVSHPLTISQQRRNIFVYAVCTCLQYLAAPVLYVGMTQASLCKELHASEVTANMPEMAFFIVTFVPLLVAWWFPGAGMLKPLMAGSYFLSSLSLGLVAISLVTNVSNDVKIAAVVLQGLVCGATISTAVALLWESMGRGVEESRRGAALAVAYGIGPFLAFGASLLSQQVLTGTMWGLWTSKLGYPWNFVVLFAAAAPMMLVASLASVLVVVPPSQDDHVRHSPFAGLLEFLTTPVLAKATIVTILLYVGNTITANMNLYTTYALGANPQEYVGYQNACRFFFKGVIGLLLGWVLVRSNPRTGILVTGMLYVASQVWALSVPGVAYLFAFALYGAGELVGVYAPNYILSASPPHRMRQNMGYATLMMLPAAPANYWFGLIAQYSSENRGVGLQLSFTVCACILLVGVILAATLPARPHVEYRSP